MKKILSILFVTSLAIFLFQSDGFCRTAKSINMPPDVYCGDGWCAPGETNISCCLDCGWCGDAFCCENEEGVCEADCEAPPPVCGDGTCNSGETNISCCEDCGWCGDSILCSNEDPDTCPSDGVNPFCGNAVCEVGENSLNCCGDCGWCGDGICCAAAGEKSKGSYCQADCGGGSIPEDEPYIEDMPKRIPR